MCEPGKPCPEPVIYPLQQNYPHLWAFFDGAMSANSGGRARPDHFTHFTQEQMRRAETELSDLCMGHESIKDAHWYGMLADSGYTIHGQTRQSEPEAGDDEQHVLVAFELLNRMY